MLDSISASLTLAIQSVTITNAIMDDFFSSFYRMA